MQNLTIQIFLRTGLIVSSHTFSNFQQICRALVRTKRCELYMELGIYFELGDGFDEIPDGTHRPFQHQLSTILKLSW